MFGDSIVGDHTGKVRGRMSSYDGELKDDRGAGWLGCELCVCEFRFCF